MQDSDVGKDDGSGMEETCDGVKWGCSHGGEDGWGCCRGMRDGLEEGGKRGSDCSRSGKKSDNDLRFESNHIEFSQITMIMIEASRITIEAH